MNKFKIAMLSAATAAFLAPAFASAEGMYVSVGAGYAMPAKKFKVYNSKDNVVGSAHKQKKLAIVNTELGISFGDLRTGLELSYLPKAKYAFTDSGVKFNGEVKNTLAMFVNGYYDIKGLSETFVPYVTAGIGFAGYKYELASSETNNSIIVNKSTKRKRGSNFAWKVGLGTMINMSENIALDISYKYMDLGSIKSHKNTNIVSGFKRTAHTFNGAVVFKF